MFNIILASRDDIDIDFYVIFDLERLETKQKDEEETEEEKDKDDETDDGQLPKKFTMCSFNFDMTN